MREMLIVGAVLLLALVVRAYRLGVIADGGYHTFNEGFYLLNAIRELSRGPFDWLTAPLDINNPPLYTLLVSLMMRVVGRTIAAARGVSAVAGVITVLYAYLLGRLLYTKRVGRVAALMLAVMPGVVLVNHNAQVDSLMVMFTVAGVHHFCRSLVSGARFQAALGGALLGLGLATKLPAVLVVGVLAIWQTWRTRGLAWLKDVRTWYFAGGFVLLGAPWYVVQLVRDASAYLGTQGALAASASEKPMSFAFFKRVYLGELAFFTMPVALVLALAGLVYMARKRTPGDALVLTWLAVETAFYLAFRFHSYYLLPFGPLLALALGRGYAALVARRPVRAWPLALGVLAALMLVSSALLLAAVKYGKWSPVAVRDIIEPDEETVVYVTDEIMGNYQPMVEHTLAPARIVWLPATFASAADLQAPVRGRAFVVTYGTFTNPDGSDMLPQATCTEESWGIVIGGVRLVQEPLNRHFFGTKRIDVRFVGRPLIGFSRETVSSGVNIYDVHDVLAPASP